MFISMHLSYTSVLDLCEVKHLIWFWMNSKGELCYRKSNFLQLGLLYYDTSDWIVQRYCDILQYKHWCSIKYVQKILELCVVKYNVISWCSEFQKNAVNTTGVAIAVYLVSSEEWNCKNSVGPYSSFYLAVCE